MSLTEEISTLFYAVCFLCLPNMPGHQGWDGVERDVMVFSLFLLVLLFPLSFPKSILDIV